MRLRAKLLAAVVAMMGLLLVIALAALWADISHHRIKERARLEQLLSAIEKEVEPDKLAALRRRLEASRLLEVPAELSSIFWVMVVGTAALAVVLYILTSHLVVLPLERLLAAVRDPGEKGPARAAGSERRDELGELITSFNRMSQEVYQTRRELEERVRAALENYRRTMEKLALSQRLSATGKLAAGIAHEINNPLGGMLNAARTLRAKHPAEGKDAEYLELILEGLTRIEATVKKLLHFSRQSPTLAPLALHEALRSALSFAEHRRSELRVEVKEEFPAQELVVLGDHRELEQVFLNLILNALEAMRGREVRLLTIGLSREEPFARVEIMDTGCGMSEGELSQAFDLFYTTRREGTGLGLPVAYAMVTNHGGELSLTSKPGEGTRALVKLPLATEQPSSP